MSSKEVEIIIDYTIRTFYVFFILMVPQFNIVEVIIYFILNSYLSFFKKYNNISLLLIIYTCISSAIGLDLKKVRRSSTHILGSSSIWPQNYVATLPANSHYSSLLGKHQITYTCKLFNSSLDPKSSVATLSTNSHPTSLLGNCQISTILQNLMAYTHHRWGLT